MRIRTRVTAFALGFRDGWQQPYELSSSTNVEHLTGGALGEIQETLDRGINVGQRCRSPRHHQYSKHNG